MAEILDHPDKDIPIDEYTFRFKEGTVTVKTKDGKPFDLKMTNWLLQSSHSYLMKLSFEE
jgi:hypothetical protein